MVFKNNKGVNYMFNTIEEAIEDIGMVIVVDDESRENEGDLLSS
ncbi:3,4-dihydroxy-2-butanone 4-phosphate synthase family protein [Clostridioides difficile DA00165]|nr:3,4-dihydroxy-2-butanone 4-phosphate synthase family protein [Clostridioides difficile DA00165]